MTQWELAIRLTLLITAAILAGFAMWRVTHSPRPHQRYIMMSWVLLLVVVVGDQYDRLREPLSWRTFTITIALILGWLGERSWRKRDRDPLRNS